MAEDELYVAAKELQAPYQLVKEVAAETVQETYALLRTAQQTDAP